MDIKFTEKFNENSETLLRRSGYAKQIDKRMGKISYFRSMTTQHFPKFHIYVENERPLYLTIHLDQKPHTYEGQRAHGGEYDGDLINREVARVRAAIIKQVASVKPALKKEASETEEKGFFGRLFG